MTVQIKTLGYQIRLQEEPEGGYTVIVPALPGCITYGSGMPEAIDMAQEAIELYLESMAASRESTATIPNEPNNLL
jgi:predicted RNase H-like HicB family nuclease